jgi:hypothetical protein
MKGPLTCNKANSDIQSLESCSYALVCPFTGRFRQSLPCDKDGYSKCAMGINVRFNCSVEVCFSFSTKSWDFVVFSTNKINVCKSKDGRSQWPCGLRRWSWSVGCWDRGFESRSWHGCLSASFCVVLSCVCRGLATG